MLLRDIAATYKTESNDTSTQSKSILFSLALLVHINLLIDVSPPLQSNHCSHGLIHPSLMETYSKSWQFEPGCPSSQAVQDVLPLIQECPTLPKLLLNEFFEE